MAKFTRETTQGYTDAHLAELNAEWETIVESEGLTPDSPEWKRRSEQLLADFDARHPITENL